MSTILNIYKTRQVEGNYSVDEPHVRVLWPGNESTEEVRSIFENVRSLCWINGEEENLISFLSKNGFIPLPSREIMIYI